MTYFTINAILEESFLKKDGEVNNLSSDSKKTLLTFLFIINCLVFALLFNMNSNSKIRLESQKTIHKSMANKVEIEDKHAKVFVTEDQQSIAIGRQGQNVRLASKLTGFELDIELAEAPKKKKKTNVEDSLLDAIAEASE